MRTVSNFFCTLLFIVLTAASAMAQSPAAGPTPCKLGLRDSPEFRSIRLGMSPQEVAATLKINFDPWVMDVNGTYQPDPIDGKESEEFYLEQMDVGAKGYFWEPNPRADRPKTLARVIQLGLFFFDDQLYMLGVKLDNKDPIFDTWPQKYDGIVECQDFIVVSTYPEKLDDPSQFWQFSIKDTAAADELVRRIQQRVKEYYLTNQEIILEKKGQVSGSK
jgi:hypothetical protein